MLFEARTDGIPAVAIRSISDTVDEDLPLDMNEVFTESGEVSMPRVLGQVAMRPQSLPALVRLGRKSKQAAESLAEFLDRYIVALSKGLRPWNQVLPRPLRGKQNTERGMSQTIAHSGLDQAFRSRMAKCAPACTAAKGAWWWSRFPFPRSATGEVLFRVAACGICGTDIKKIHHGFLPPPQILGHELAGTVVQVGAASRNSSRATAS